MHIIFGMQLLSFEELVKLSFTCKTLKKMISEIGPYNNAYSSVFDLYLPRYLTENYGITRPSLDKVLDDHDAFVGGSLITDVIKGIRYSITISNLDLYVTTQEYYEGVQNALIALGYRFLQEKEGRGGDVSSRDEDIWAEGDLKYNKSLKNSYFMNSHTLNTINVVLVANQKRENITPISVVKNFDLSHDSNYYRGPKELYIGCAVDIMDNQWRRNDNTMFQVVGINRRHKRILKYIARGCTERMQAKANKLYAQVFAFSNNGCKYHHLYGVWSGYDNYGYDASCAAGIYDAGGWYEHETQLNLYGEDFNDEELL